MSSCVHAREKICICRTLCGSRPTATLYDMRIVFQGSNAATFPFRKWQPFCTEAIGRRFTVGYGRRTAAVTRQMCYCWLCQACSRRTSAVSRMMGYGSREQTLLWQAYGRLPGNIYAASQKKIKKYRYMA